MLPNAEPAPRKAGGRVKTGVAIILYALIFYVLSFGPACRVFTRTDNEAVLNWIEKFYRPLMWLRWKLHFTEQLDWYVSLWS